MTVAEWGRDFDVAEASGPIVTPVSLVTPEPVQWLWKPYVPRGALVLLDGHPDTGKSTITLDLAARLSRGARMPDGSLGASGASLLLSTEDSLATPVRERLEAAEANLDRIYGLEARDPGSPFGRFLSFPADAGILEHAVTSYDITLAVIDPIMGHFSGGINTGNDAEVRQALNPLVRVAAQTGCTILMVRHLRAPERGKVQRPSFLEGGGSKGGFGIVRAGLMAMRDPEDESTCTLHVTKHNYGQWARPVEYAFTQVGGVGRIRWMPR